jgi:ubiquinone biosynthesis protein
MRENRRIRVLVATDRSETAQRAEAWAADLAGRFGAELVLLQIVPPSADSEAADAEARLGEVARELGGRAVVRVDADAPRAIVGEADAEDADVLVVGNAGMGGRKEFLLGNIPNRISHNARCTVVIVNTMEGAAPPAEELEADEEEGGGLLARAAHIGRVLARYGLDEARGVKGSLAERARRLRDALEELGPTFAKLGQILSTRPDLLPPEFVDELATLQDRVAPLSEEEVVAVMEAELGVPWEDVFETIESEPLAAGTIGQVHRATLENGDRVVVKVQRPTARDEIVRDLGLLELFAEKASSRPGLREVIDIPALAEHLSSSLRRELDFGVEAQNIERMRRVLEPYDRLAVPALYADLSTTRLLVMEEVQGDPISKAPEGPEREEAARQLLEAYYRQILQDGFFHADPHPGNLMWWDGRIYFLDFGMCGEVEPELRELMTLLLLAFWRNDPGFLADVILMLAGPRTPLDLDLDALETEFAAYIERFGGAGSLRDIRIGAMLEGLTDIATRHRIRLPAALALSGKAFGQMQLAVAQLSPTLDPFDVVSSFLFRSVRERLVEHADPQRLFYEGQKLKLRAARLLEAVERTAGARPGGRLQVEFLGTQQIEEAIQRSAKRVAIAGVGAAALVALLAAWIGAGGPRQPRS